MCLASNIVLAAPAHKPLPSTFLGRVRSCRPKSGLDHLLPMDEPYPGPHGACRVSLTAETFRPMMVRGEPPPGLCVCVCLQDTGAAFLVAAHGPGGGRLGSRT